MNNRKGVSRAFGGLGWNSISRSRRKGGEGREETMATIKISIPRRGDLVDAGTPGEAIERRDNYRSFRSEREPSCRGVFWGRRPFQVHTRVDNAPTLSSSRLPLHSLLTNYSTPWKEHPPPSLSLPPLKGQISKSDRHRPISDTERTMLLSRCSHDLTSDPLSEPLDVSNKIDNFWQHWIL